MLGLEILNIGYAGPGIPLRLAVDPGDDRLDVIVIREEHREDMLDWLGPAQEDKPAPVSVRRGAKIVVHWKGKPAMRIDDGFVEPPDTGKARITITLQEEPVTVWLPKPERAAKAKPKTARKAARKKTAAAKKPAKPKAKPRKRG